ncbi:MAG: hypothetical protein L0Z55_09250 [Planctomycetes bacterium]|nr:hypothetical protein [Planctomycetota bacterium]
MPEAALEARSVIVCGLGPIGAAVAARLDAMNGNVAALVDVDRSAAENAGRELAAAPAIYESLPAALEKHAPAPVVLCTASGFDEIAADLQAATQAGSSVVTSCEEAVWPYHRHAGLARTIDRGARAGGTAIIAGGINPGFLMDVLPALLTAPFPPPARVVVTRRVDVATRRRPLQEKVGFGLTAAEFEARKRAGRIGHRGLEESMCLFGAALEFAWERVESTLEPVIAESCVQMEGRQLAAGTVLGMHNRGRAWLGGACRLELDLLMAYGLPDPVDRVELFGDAPLPARFEVAGGVAGDAGTLWMIVHLLRQLERLPRGLCTMLDVPGGVRG